MSRGLTSRQPSWSACALRSGSMVWFSDRMTSICCPDQYPRRSWAVTVSVTELSPRSLANSFPFLNFKTFLYNITSCQWSWKGRNAPASIPSTQAIHPFVDIAVNIQDTRRSELGFTSSTNNSDRIYVESKGFFHGHFAYLSGGYALKNGLEGLNCRNGATLLREPFTLAIWRTGVVVYIGSHRRRDMKRVRTCLSRIRQLRIVKTSQVSAGSGQRQLPRYSHPHQIGGK